MTPLTTKFLIVGAGPTGLGAAYRLKELGEKDFIIIDAEASVGGLARSFRDAQGFTWDIGGHVQFSHYTYFDDLMSRLFAPSEMLHHERESWVWLRDRFVPYPFQNNLRYLPKEELWSCLDSLTDLQATPATRLPATFKEWIEGTFGKGIAEVFMFPYNFKVWAFPLEKMSHTWIGQRVAISEFKRILRNIVLDRDDLSWGPNNTFQFPRTGGTGAIWERVADEVGRDKIALGTKLATLQPTNHVARCSDGRKIQYQHCLSTIPLDRLTESTEGIPETIRREAKRLVHTTTNVIGIGIEGRVPETLKGKCWIYFPEGNCPFYRVTVFSHYSPHNVPDPLRQWSLMAEVSESPHKKVDPHTLLDDVVKGMINTKLVDPKMKIVSRMHLRVDYGYPVPSLDRDRILSLVHPILEEFDIYSRGRFGGWRYEVSNQDHSFMQGVEWADRILYEDSEETYQCKKGLGKKEPRPIRKVAA